MRRNELSCASSQSRKKTSECTSPWSYCDNGTCKCGKIREDILRCHLERNSTVSFGHCITFDENTGITEVGDCMYNPSNKKESREVEKSSALPFCARDSGISLMTSCAVHSIGMAHSVVSVKMATIPLLILLT